MDETGIRIEKLKNGLTLQVVDISKKTAGDRWYAGILLKIEIPISMLSDSSLPLDEIRQAFGEMVCYELKRERHFIDELNKMSVINAMEKSLLDSVLPYVSLPDFAVRCVQKKYKDYLNKKRIEERQRLG